MRVRLLFTSVIANRRELVPLILAVLAAAISLDFTITGCASSWPANAKLEVCALGFLCEVAKLYFGPQAISGLMSSCWSTRLRYVPLAALTLALIACSIAASFSSTVEAQNQELSRATSESLAYERALGDVQTYSTQIAALLQIQAADLQDNRRTRAREAMDQVSVLRKLRDTAAVELATANGGAPAVSFAHLLGARTDADIGALRAAAHLVAAVLLELVGITAAVMLHTRRRLCELARKSCEEAPTLAADTGEVAADSETTTNARACDGLSAVDERPVVHHQHHSGPASRSYARVKNAVRRGALKPTLRAVREFSGVSQGPAMRILQMLNEDGVTQLKGGRRYVCNTNADVH